MNRSELGTIQRELHVRGPEEGHKRMSVWLGTENLIRTNNDRRIPVSTALSRVGC